MAAALRLFVLLTVLSSAYSQLTLSGANVEPLTTGRVGDVYPVRFYTGFLKNPVAGISISRIFQTDLDACLRECVNQNGAVSPVNVVCNAVDWLVGQTSPGINCITHFDAPCSIANALYTATAGWTHYKVVHLCDDTRIVQLPGQFAINTASLPAGVVATNELGQLNAVDCALLCNLRTTCIAIDFSTFSNCRHFSTATPVFGTCLSTIAQTGATVWQFPCNDAPFTGIMVGLIPNAVPQTPTTADFFSCRALCEADTECIGYQYNTIEEFILPEGRCGLYNKYAVTQSIPCLTAVAQRNMFTIARFACQFTAQPDMRKVGGIPMPQWRLLYECERECHYDIMCTGFDWNKEAGTRDRDRCWFHTEYNGGCEDNRAAVGMVDHYELIDSRCSINADDHYIFLGVQASGSGTVQAAAITYALCLATCNADATCQGFDFITTPATCITHLEATVCSTFNPNTLATHYRKWAYECMFRFRNAKKSGGSPQMGVTILGNCERICRQTPTCEGFDFDRTGRVPGTPCYLHLTGTVCNPLVRAADIEHYRVRTRVCPDELNVIASAGWANAMQNVHTIGNRRNGVEQSAIECLLTCQRLGNRMCAGIDYDRRTRFCYIVNRDNACRTTGSILNHVDRIQLATGCNAPVVSGYTGTGSQHRVSGQLRDRNSSPGECSTICTNDPLCSAFDFDRTSNECWTHSKTNECRNEFNTFNNVCCDHYVDSTFNCNTFAPPVFPSYTFRDRVHVRGGTPAPAALNIVTERQCTMYCSSQSTCTSVDFNFGRNECYIHDSATSCNPQSVHTLVHRYIKAGNCGV